jgi:hypothetical protein
METVERIIFECVDTVLSQLEFINKESFYASLESTYGVQPENIGSNYEKFHSALEDQVGAKRYSVERAILRVLKERTKKGLYPPPSMKLLRLTS